jgi:hypothetical protein
MGCGNESNTTFVRVGEHYNGSENDKVYYLEGCNSTFLPSLRTPGEAKASDYKQLVNNGFLLTWESPPLPPLGSGKLTHRIVIFIFHQT